MIAKLVVGGFALALIETAVGEDAHLPRARVPGHRLPAGGTGDAGHAIARGLAMTTTLPLFAQLINLFAAILLLLSFAMLAQRRVLSLIDLFAAQGLALCPPTVIVAYATKQPHLYLSAALTLILKVILLPWILHRLIRKLDVNGTSSN
jgi:hypothetical protein